MNRVSHYVLRDEVYRNNTFTLHTGTDEQNGESVLIKTPAQNTPGWYIRHMETEYHEGRESNAPGILKPIDFVPGDSPALIMEYFHGVPLATVLRGPPLETGRFLELSLAFCTALEALHRAGMAHLNLNPENIFVSDLKSFTEGNSGENYDSRNHPELPEVVFSGLEFMVSIEKFSSSPDPARLSASHLSPEISGRTGMAIDQRSDIYSAGTILYLMLTGNGPFDRYAGSDLELIHAHLTRDPVPPHSTDSSIPEILSSIIMRMLEKNPDRRSSSISAVRNDLASFREHFLTHGDEGHFIPETGRLIFPDRLYGRERETGMLRDAFNHARSGPSRLFMVGGYSGVGKTSLIMDLRWEVEQAGGIFTAGKFEQFRSDQPYSALIDACSSLVRQVLSSGDEEIDAFRTRVNEGLSPNERLIIDMVPEVMHITGPGEEIRPAGSIEAKNRLHIYFTRFLQTFASEHRPLVIFLDDLQWVDLATLELVTFLMESGTKHILLIGAFRDNEVKKDHPLSQVIEDLSGRYNSLNVISLTDLELNDITSITAHCFAMEDNDARELAALVYRKTGGNPFFTREFLEHIHKRKLVRPGSGRWTIDTEGINALASSLNVVELISARLHSLPVNFQAVLKAASCVSGTFNAEFIAEVLNAHIKETTAAMGELVQSGLFLQQGTTFHFSHDRVREESLRMLDENERLMLNLRIGSLLRESLNEDSRDEFLFRAADHLNTASTLITGEDEKVRLASLNLKAGLASKARAAFGPALSYFRAGAAALGDTQWHGNYDLTRDLLHELAETEYLNGNFRESEMIVNGNIDTLRTDIEKAEFLNILVMQYQLEGKPEQSIQRGLEALKFLNIEFQLSAPQDLIKSYLNRIETILEKNSIGSFIERPEITDREVLLSLLILINLNDPCYLCNPELLVLISLKSLLITMEQGNSPMAAHCFLLHTLISVILSDDYTTAFSFLDLTLQIIDKRSDTHCLPDVYMKSALMNYWQKSLAESDKLNELGLQEGLKTGRINCVGYIKIHAIINNFFRGCPLKNIHTQIIDELNFFSSMKIQAMKNILFFLKIPAYALTDIHSLYPDENEYNILLKECMDSGQTAAMCQYYLLNAQVDYLFENYAHAFTALTNADKIIQSLVIIIHSTYLPLYRCLTLCAMFPDAPEKERREYLEQIEMDIKKMKLWAGNCPENFLHKQHLMEAEQCRVTGREMEAVSFYERAAAGAEEQGFLQEQALAEELAGKFWHTRDNPGYASFHFKAARDLYNEWGAVKKAEHLEEHYPEYFATTGTSSSPGNSTDSGHPYDSIDTASLVAASRALSEEIEIRSLTKKILETGIQNSGAQRGCLFMERDEGLFLEASGPDDNGTIQALQSIPFDECSNVPQSVLRYVMKTGETLILENACTDETFHHDPYISENRIKSLLCMPLKHSGKRVAIGYLENNLIANVFTKKRTDMLNILAGQAAISLQNSHLYEKQRSLAHSLRKLNRLKDQILGNYNSERYRNLQDRMMPHFFFNAINAVHSLIISNQEKAVEAILTLSDIYHYIVDRSFELLVPFMEEWVFVENYLGFEKIRYPKTLSYSTDISGDFEGIMIPPLSIQPLVGNAIKHGLRKREGAGSVSISATVKNNIVHIEVTDDGAGIDCPDPYTRSLGNIRDRLRFHFPDADLQLTANGETGARSVIQYTAHGERLDEAENKI